MRIGRVLGTITLNRAYPTLHSAQLLVVQVEDRFSLAHKPAATAETLVVYDELFAGHGELIAFSESREAAMPFYPEKLVPIDAYNAAILDRVTIEWEFPA